MSEELVDEIRIAVDKEEPEILIYKVRYQLVDKTLRTHYKQFKNYYQTRLFNKKSGARFKKKMHERIFFADHLKIGVIESPWFVVLQEDLDFNVYKEKVSYRIGIMVDGSDISNPILFIKKGLFTPIKEILKYILKIVYLRVRYKKNELIPLRYELNRLYSQILMIKKMTQKFIRQI
jgi:hypothetical protein